MDWYVVAKDFQTLTASLIALSAAVLTYRGVRHSAEKAFESADNAARINIGFQERQSQQVHDNRHNAVSRWMYMRAVTTHRSIQSNLSKIKTLKFMYDLAVIQDEKLVRTNTGLVVAANVIENLSPIFTGSDLEKKLELDFLMTIEPETQSTYFMIIQNVINFDDGIASAQRDIKNFLAQSADTLWIEGEGILDMMFRDIERSKDGWLLIAEVAEASLAKQLKNGEAGASTIEVTEMSQR